VLYETEKACLHQGLCFVHMEGMIFEL